jgi:hypothetical protein
VAQLSDHLRICFDESKSKNRKNFVFSTKNFAFSIGTRFALNPPATGFLRICPRLKCAPAIQNRKPKQRVFNERIEYVGTINQRTAVRNHNGYDGGSTGSDKPARSDGDLLGLVRHASGSTAANFGRMRRFAGNHASAAGRRNYVAQMFSVRQAAGANSLIAQGDCQKENF